MRRLFQPLSITRCAAVHRLHRLAAGSWQQSLHPCRADRVMGGHDKCFHDLDLI